MLELIEDVTVTIGKNSKPMVVETLDKQTVLSALADMKHVKKGQIKTCSIN